MYQIKRTALYIPIANVTNKGILTVNYHCEEKSLSYDYIYEKMFNDLQTITEGKPALNIRYYISCNIILRNQNNSTFRTFHGHFSFHDENLVALSQFKELKSQDELKSAVETALTPRNIDRILIQPFIHSNYTYQRIQAVVISFQIYVSRHQLNIIRSCENKVSTVEL